MKDINENSEKPEITSVKKEEKIVEVVDEQRPSTSKAAIEKEEIMESKSNPKKSRIDFNFWSDNEVSESAIEEKEKEREVIKIKELKIGKIFGIPLKFRVIFVSEVRNVKRTTAIDFHGMDETSEISFINFGHNCEKIHGILKVNSIYSITNFNVCEENPDYPSLCNNKLQVHITNETQFEDILIDNDIPDIVFNFISLNDVQNLKKNDLVDAVGILVKDFGLEKNWKGTPMRELALTDEKKEKLIITLWSKAAENFVAEKFSVIMIRRAIVTEYENLKKLNCISGTLVWVCPDVEHAYVKFKLFQDILAEHKLT